LIGFDNIPNESVADTQIMHDWQNDGQTHEWRRSFLRANLATSTVKQRFAKADAPSN